MQVVANRKQLDYLSSGKSLGPDSAQYKFSFETFGFLFVYPCNTLIIAQLFCFVKFFCILGVVFRQALPSGRYTGWRIHKKPCRLFARVGG